MARAGDLALPLIRARANTVILREAEQDPARVAEALARACAELVDDGVLSTEDVASVLESLLAELDPRRGRRADN
jgi:hypothetical protein